MNWILITGDSRGLGFEITHLLLKKGIQVIGISRSTNQNIRNLQNCFRDDFLHINYDLSNTNGIKGLFLDQITQKRPIRGLVVNAAIAYDDLVTNANNERLDQLFRTNVQSSILMTKYAIRNMIFNDLPGSLVYISSVCAHTGYKGLSMYSATKGAIESFSKTVAREWGIKRIRSNCVAPGFMETDMSSSLDRKQRDRIFKRTSIGTATDLRSVAETVLFLLDEASSSITGQVLHVDNGTI